MYNVTLIPGDGIGPEVSKSMVRVVEATGIDINWEIVNAGLNVIEEYNTPLPDHVIESIKKNKIAIKGPITTPVGKGFKSVNVTLRQALDLYVNLRPIKTFKGIKSRYENVDLVIVRENTEDLYAGIEHKVGDYGAESIKIITKGACERIVEFACDYVKENNRKKLTGVHKANIMKLTDGLFLKVFRDISEKNKINYNDLIVDAAAMNLVLNPEKYDVLVMPNLYGDILSDLCAGLVGGLGIIPGANIGKDYAIFEAVHGSAPDIAGMNKANPTALIQSAIMMLRYLGEYDAAKKIERALEKVFIEGRVLTIDLGGNATTDEFTDELCKYVLEGVKAY
ncbi:isocitrate/isopropylmalate dehydrogenase family protein [Romboutsia ilealis]|uniref:Isocitrate/isopropylmalate dehydrogenase family protein n=1 Tax=Romboutsia faecis TaxID=2764597 RepID=A0ABR7JP44_9FIRM|nr:isocitrate/isopropylmalate dehydrogenase family protein [Romboutsia faecis]MBC5996674.1 isocitrate/isopropylmalate dehydrogenase family protein [Romboutsia faecis]MRN24200.1 isocitrate/isopropylmalate dehydrogenase family protein [Romboutsia ilealis]